MQDTGLVFTRNGYTFAWAGPQSQARAITMHMLARGWVLQPATWGASVLAVGAL